MAGGWCWQSAINSFALTKAADTRQTNVGQQMLDNRMAETADSADDDVAAAVISVIAFCYDSRELMYRINMDISHTSQ